jgi:hypothetical protein
MGLFRKNKDPLENRAKSVQEKLTDLQSQIEELGDPSQPFAAQPAPAVHDLNTDPNPLPRRPAEAASAQPLDTLAQRPEKLWDRITKNFRKPPVSNNPKLVNFLAAGSIQGLRPLRYERRVARNRFLAFTTILVLVLIGLFWTLIQQ